MKNKILAVLLTCHNRRETTLLCLKHLCEQSVPSYWKFRIYLVDDGCTDGTAEAVGRLFPNVTIVKGNGNLYWCGGMRYAWTTAAAEGTYSAYVWLNDDTFLSPGALLRLVETYEQLRSRDRTTSIVVGSVTGVDEESFAFGGLNRKHPWRPYAFWDVVPSDEPLLCDTFCGNLVLIPREVVEKVGILDDQFTHSFGDMDYGLRATQCGCTPFVAPGYFGVCPDGPPSPLKSNNLFRRLKVLLTPKGYPLRDSFVYCRRYAGPFWLGIWIFSYLKVIFRWYKHAPPPSPARVAKT